MMRKMIGSVVSALGLTVAGADWTLETAGVCAVFSEQTGAVVSLRGADGIERVRPRFALLAKTGRFRHIRFRRWRQLSSEE